MSPLVFVCVCLLVVVGVDAVPITPCPTGTGLASVSETSAPITVTTSTATAYSNALAGFSAQSGKLGTTQTLTQINLVGTPNQCAATVSFSNTGAATSVSLGGTNAQTLSLDAAGAITAGTNTFYKGTCTFPTIDSADNYIIAAGTSSVPTTVSLSLSTNQNQFTDSDPVNGGSTNPNGDYNIYSGFVTATNPSIGQYAPYATTFLGSISTGKSFTTGLSSGPLTVYGANSNQGTISSSTTLSGTVTASPTVGQVVATYCYSYTSSGGSGDPQFIGFQGQHFQVHGTPDEHYNLISTPSYYVNAKFIYMANGQCTYNETECFSHPGTYIGEIGIVYGQARLKIAAGPHATGLTVFFNDKLVAVGTKLRLSNETSVHVISASRVSIHLDDLKLQFVNSDMFVNMGAEFTNAALLQAGLVKVSVPASASPADADKLVSTSYPEFLMHGLLGQSWRNIHWPHAKLYQGEPSDYQVASLMNHEFLFSQYL